MNKIKEFMHKHPVIYTIIIMAIVIILTALIMYIVNNINNKEEVQDKNVNKINQPETPIQKQEEKKIDNTNSGGVEENQIDNTNSNSAQKNQTGTITNNYNQEQTVTKDEEIINYFTEQNNIVSNSDENNVTTREKIKNEFTNIYNFLFNGGTIKGTTFKELRTETKLKVLEKSIELDYKINQKFPNYKDNIKEKCQNLKAKCISKYLEITDDICTNNESLCTSARENFNTMKNSFSITIDFIKESTKKGTNKIKEWWNKNS